MMRSLKRVSLKDKTVLVRIDADVPLTEDLQVADDERLRDALPTLKYLRKAKRVILLGHVGRPVGLDMQYSVAPVAERLSKLLNVKVVKTAEVLPHELPDRKWIMLENLRFDKREKEDDAGFAKKLAAYGDIFVNEAFANSHRKHASIHAISRYVKAYPGFHLQHEVKTIKHLLTQLHHPLHLVIGGAKIDKVHQLQPLIEQADKVLLGGALLFTFLKALGVPVGKSKIEEKRVREARHLLHHYKTKLVLPLDVVLDDGRVVGVHSIPEGRRGLDLGPLTIAHYQHLLAKAKSILWNGPLGYCEQQPFDTATKKIGNAIAQSDAISLVGGGDTLRVVDALEDQFTHASSAGGAFLQLVSGEALPGLEVLGETK